MRGLVGRWINGRLVAWVLMNSLVGGWVGEWVVSRMGLMNGWFGRWVREMMVSRVSFDE